MTTPAHSIRVALALAAVCVMSGCGGSKEEALPTPPPAPKAADMTIAPSPNAAAPGAPGQAPSATQVATPPPPPIDTPEGFAAVTKGLTPSQIEDYKSQATIEKFDLNLQSLQTAANSYYNEFRKRPPTVEAMVAAGFLQSAPNPPKGKKYVINPENGEITSVAK